MRVANNEYQDAIIDEKSAPWIADVMYVFVFFFNLLMKEKSFSILVEWKLTKKPRFNSSITIGIASQLGWLMAMP